MPLLLFTLLFFPHLMAAEIIPDDRLAPWAGNVGVIGGIPTRDTIYKNMVTDLGADPTGVADASSIIHNALASCPEGQVVYMPEGTFKISSRMAYQTGNNKTLRGAGPALTKLKPSGPISVLYIGVGDYPRLTASKTITAGATKGSTTITVASTSDVAVGELIRIEAGNPPKYVHGEQNPPVPTPTPLPLGSAGGTLGWMSRITAKTSTTITFAPPLPMDISTLTPKAAVYSAYGTGGTVTGYGFEDFDIDATGSDMNQGIAMTQAYGCWIKNVNVHNFSHQAFAIVTSVNCEFRHCYIYTGGQGSGSEGFDFVTDDSWNLAEDNIVYDGGTINLNDAGAQVSANVIAYNYLYGHRVTAAGLQVLDLDLGHGAHDTFNLIEGNVIGLLMGGDSYFGGSSHNTILRNLITATNPYGYIDGRRAILLKQYNPYYNIVGNVLGTSAFPTTNNGIKDGATTPPYATGGYYEAPIVSGYDNGTSTHVSTIYEFGFPQIGNTSFSGTIPLATPPDYSQESPYNTLGTRWDPNVKATLIRHGNYDYFNQAIVWDPAISDHVIPDSLYLSGKPSYFGDLTWPPVDSANPNTDPTIIPAAYRFVNGSDPPGGDGSPSAPEGLHIVP